MGRKILEYSDFNDKYFDNAYKIIKKSKNILVWGDEDPDGMTATAVLVKALQLMNKKVNYYVPSRERDGIGLNIKKLKILMKKYKFDTLITVDCGSVNNNEIEFSLNEKKKVIITDHHVPYKTLVKKVPYINTHLLKSKKFKDLAGVGVSLILSTYIIKKHFKLYSYMKALHYINENIYISIAGTICDRVKIKGFNKYLYDYKDEFSNIFPDFDFCNNDYSCICGLIYMSKTEGLKNIIVDYFIKNKESKKIIKQLNIKRKKNIKRIENLTERTLKKIDKNKKIVLYYNSKIHWSFIGVVASRISAELNKPVCIISKKDNYYVGEVRSDVKFNWIKILNRFSEYFINWGGHKQAAGFSIEKEQLNAFILDFNNFINKY